VGGWVGEGGGEAERRDGYLEEVLAVHQDGGQDVHGAVDGEGPQVGLWQEGEDVGHATPPGMQEVAGQPAGKLAVSGALQAGQSRGGQPLPVVQAQLLRIAKEWMWALCIP